MAGQGSRAGNHTKKPPACEARQDGGLGAGSGPGFEQLVQAGDLGDLAHVLRQPT